MKENERGQRVQERERGKMKAKMIGMMMGRYGARERELIGEEP